MARTRLPGSTSRAFANLASLVKPDGLLIYSENFVHQRNPREAKQVNRSLAEIEFLRGRWVRALGQTADVRGDELSVGSTIRVHRLCWRALVLVGRLKERPSTELMLCRRLPDP